MPPRGLRQVLTNGASGLMNQIFRNLADDRGSAAHADECHTMEVERAKLAIDEP